MRNSISQRSRRGKGGGPDDRHDENCYLDERDGQDELSGPSQAGVFLIAIRYELRQTVAADLENRKARVKKAGGKIKAANGRGSNSCHVNQPRSAAPSDNHSAIPQCAHARKHHRPAPNAAGIAKVTIMKAAKTGQTVRSSVVQK